MSSGRFYNDQCNYNKYLQETTDPYNYRVNLFGYAHGNILEHGCFQTRCKTIEQEGKLLRFAANTDLCMVPNNTNEEFCPINSATWRNPAFSEWYSRFTHPLDNYKEMNIQANRIFVENVKPDDRGYFWTPLNSALHMRDQFDGRRAMPNKSLDGVPMHNTLERPDHSKHRVRCN